MKNCISREDYELTGFSTGEWAPYVVDKSICQTVCRIVRWPVEWIVLDEAWILLYDEVEDDLNAIWRG